MVFICNNLRHSGLSAKHIHIIKRTLILILKFITTTMYFASIKHNIRKFKELKLSYLQYDIVCVQGILNHCTVDLLFDWFGIVV
jgi:hypothetical protein